MKKATTFAVALVLAGVVSGILLVRQPPHGEQSNASSPGSLISSQTSDDAGVAPTSETAGTPDSALTVPITTVHPTALFSRANVGDLDDPSAYTRGMAILGDFGWLRPSRHEMVRVDRSAVDRFFTPISASNTRLADSFNFTIYPETECIVDSIDYVSESDDGTGKIAHGACSNLAREGFNPSSVTATFNGRNQTIVVVVKVDRREYRLHGIPDSEFAMILEVDLYSQPVMPSVNDSITDR